MAEEIRKMACRMMKKGLIGVGLGAAALFALFGGKALHYTRYAAEKVQENARAAVPFDADVQSARQQVKALDPAIDRGIESLVKLEDSLGEVRGEIVALQGQIDASGRKIQSLRASLDDSGVRRVSDSDVAGRRVESDLAREIDGFRWARFTLGERQKELTHREAQYRSLYDKLQQMRAQKAALLVKIQAIEARHDAMEVTEGYNEFRIDTSPLAEAQKAVEELERRVNMDSRRGELRSEFSEGTERPSSGLEPGRDVRGEADEILGADSTRTAEKEL